MLRDVRHAARVLLQSKTWTLMVILSLALGIGANTAIVMRESLALVVIGVVLGLATALAAGRLVTSLLFGLAPTDAITLAVAIVVMVAVSTVAGCRPARTASRVDPLIALRYE